MILQFELNDGRDCYFDVENLFVTDNSVDYGSVILYIDGEPYDQSVETWEGHRLSDEDILEQTINAYLRNDTETYRGFSSKWDVFDPLTLSEQYDSSIGLATVLPVIEFGEVVEYSLDMATPDFSFYGHDDSVKVFNAQGGLVTDYENFYMEALYGEYEKAVNGETELLYITPEVEEYLQESLEEE